MNFLRVTNNNDSGLGSLREAIANAQAGDTITFDNNLGGNNRITLSSQLVINKDLTIDGQNAPGLTLSGNDQLRVLDIRPSSAFDFETGLFTDPTEVTLKDLVVTNGRAFGPGDDGAGGGIRTGNQTNLTLVNSQVNNSSAEFAGGISIGFLASATILNSKFNNNDGTRGNDERGGGRSPPKPEGP